MSQAGGNRDRKLGLEIRRDRKRHSRRLGVSLVLGSEMKLGRPGGDVQLEDGYRAADADTNVQVSRHTIGRHSPPNKCVKLPLEDEHGQPEATLRALPTLATPLWCVFGAPHPL